MASSLDRRERAGTSTFERLPVAHLESWMRRYYFESDFDIGSSGVESFSLEELRELLGIELSELDGIVFDDSRTLGGGELREAIGERWGGGNPARVMATHGSSEAIYLVMQSLLAPGDEVIAVAPCYQQLYSIAESIGCRLNFWELKYEQGFHPELDEFEKLITRATKMVVVNFPHNPTGATLTRDEQDRLIEVVGRTGAYLVWDGAFADLIYDGDPLPDAGGKYERAITIGTLSKAYGLPGLRVGWCLAHEGVLDRLIHLRDYITLHLSPLIELIARRVIEKADLLLEKRMRQARNNLSIVSEWMKEHDEMLRWVPPAGGVSAFPRFLKTGNTEPFCRILGEQHKTLLVPGSSFRVPQHVRLGFGGRTNDLREGLSRFSALLEEFQG